MPKLLFLGSRLDCVTTLYGAAQEVTFGIDSAYSDAGINVRNGGVQGLLYDPAAAPLLSPYAVEAGASFYFHSHLYQTGGVYLLLLDNAGYPWVQYDYHGQLYYNSGTGTAPVWTVIGIPYAPFVSSAFDIDLRLDIASDGTHTIALAYNGTVVSGPVSFTQAALTNIARWQLQSQGQGYEDVVWSQIMCAENINTVGGHVNTCRATGAGAHSGWTGTYTDVNEVITDYTTYNQALTAGLEQSYPMTNVTVPEGCYIMGVFEWLIVKNDGVAPENVASLIRTGADVDHVSADLPGVTFGYTNVGARFDVNPDTSTQWTQAAWNAPVQLGYVSET